MASKVKDIEYVVPATITKRRKISVESDLIPRQAEKQEKTKAKKKEGLERELKGLENTLKLCNIGSIGSEEDNESEDADSDAVVLCRGVSVEAWNELLLTKHKFSGMLWFNNGEVILIEVPSKPHEIAQRMIDARFVHFMDPNAWLIPTGTNRWVGADHLGREADSSYQPDPNISAPPPNVNVKDYVTLIIEIGYAQCLGGALGLRAKAQQWLNIYPSVAYVVLVHISKRRAVFKAEVWERNAHNPTQVRNFSHGAHSITLNTRPILGLPVAAALPHGCPATVVIDLALIRTRVMSVPL